MRVNVPQFHGFCATAARGQPAPVRRDEVYQQIVTPGTLQRGEEPRIPTVSQERA